MKRFFCIMLVMAMLFSTTAVNAANEGGFEVKGLQVEYLTNPIGIDVQKPRLSWYSEADYRGMTQKSYRITMSSSLEKLQNGDYDIWDTKTVNSDVSTGIKYAGKTLPAKTRIYWQVTVIDGNGKSTTSNPAYFETGLMDKGFDADWITSSAEVEPKSENNPEGRPVNNTIKRPNDPAPMFRREFTASGKVKSARLYITSAGCYDAYINGKPVTETLLNPGRSDYNVDLKYQVFDVTEFIKDGKNAIGVYLGHGWFNTKWNNFGTKLGLMAMLEITYTSGKTQSVVTDKNWKCYGDGPIQYEDIMNGFSYDATKEQEGWAEANFNDAAWQKVDVTTASALKVSNTPVYTATPLIAVESSFTPVKVTKVGKSALTYDFGVNIAGAPYVKVKGEKGQKIKFTYGEIINNIALFTADGVSGSVYRKNLTDAQATDFYTLKGDPNGEIFYPNMTYHGFRYMQVEGVNFTITEDTFLEVEARAFCTDMERTGYFETSDELVNQLFENSYRSNVGNFIGIPTDCPQRGERTGWTADAQVYARTASFNLNTFAFLEEYAFNLTRTISSVNTYPEVTPAPTWRTSGVENGWGDAGVIIPWTLYLAYGDMDILRDNYDGMKKWVTALVAASNENYEREDKAKYGDWMGIEKTPASVTNNAYSAYSTGIVAKVARVLGYTDDAKKYEEISEKFRQAFVRVCTDQNGKTLSDTQTSYVLGLAFDLFDDEDRKTAEDRLAELITENGYKLKTGFLGVNFLNPVLSDIEHSDIAFKLLLQKEYPSWLYPVTLGATTTFEKWDGLKGINADYITSTTGSLNHYAYGSVAEWMYRYIAGIDMDEKNPAYKHIILHPETNEALTYAKGSYLSQYGKIESAWKFENGNTVYHITVPANTTATLTLKDSAEFEIKEGNISADKAEGVTRLDNAGADAKFELVSGKYTFTVVGNAPINETPDTSTDSSTDNTPSNDQSDATVSDGTESKDDGTPSENKIPVGILAAAGATVLAAASAVIAIALKKKNK